jgi:hypothetical protein
VHVLEGIMDDQITVRLPTPSGGRSGEQLAALV